MKIAILGLGEAGSHFANDLACLGFEVSGWDPALSREIHPEIRFAQHNPDAVKDADIVMSVNWTSVSKNVASEVMPYLKKDCLYCEMNTSSPKTKKEIEAILVPANICFVDLAIMAPVPPSGIKVPLLASGGGATQLAEKMSSYALNLSVLNAHTGEAAGRKLLRSIVYKGIAAVICEAMEAGKHFLLEGYIRSQIHSIIGEDDELIDRFLEGSRTHAKRRIQEMEAVVDMLEKEDLSAVMSKGTIQNLRNHISN